MFVDVGIGMIVCVGVGVFVNIGAGVFVDVCVAVGALPVVYVITSFGAAGISPS